MDVHIDTCPEISSTQLWVKIFHSVTSTYYAPSDLASIGRMYQKLIRTAPCWKGGPGRYNCVYVEKDVNASRFCGLHVACVKLFFSFLSQQEEYLCTLVEWFSTYGNSPCEDTRLWMVEPDHDLRGKRMCSVIHVDTILRLAHLIGVAGPHFLPKNFTYRDTLDTFKTFYVNKYMDHYAHEIAF